MSGHGHVTPNADGSKARCGGPAICSVCARELAQQRAELGLPKEKPVYFVGPAEGDKSFPIINRRSGQIVCWCSTYEQAREVSAQLQNGMWRDE